MIIQVKIGICLFCSWTLILIITLEFSVTFLGPLIWQRFSNQPILSSILCLFGLVPLGIISKSKVASNVIFHNFGEIIIIIRTYCLQANIVLIDAKVTFLYLQFILA